MRKRKQTIRDVADVVHAAVAGPGRVDVETDVAVVAAPAVVVDVIRFVVPPHRCVPPLGIATVSLPQRTVHKMCLIHPFEP